MIERSVDGGATFSSLSQVGANVTAYSDATVTAGQSYVYRIKAIDLTSSSNWDLSNPAIMSAGPINPMLSDPTNLSATVISTSQIDLSWIDSNTNETGFVIERSTDGGTTFSPLTQVGANVTAYSDTTVGDGQSYVYRIEAVDLTSNSNWDLSNAATTSRSR